MGSAGINRMTGRPLTDWAHVVQSLRVIFTTGVGARVMRRSFGSLIPFLLGRNNLTPRVVLNFWTAICLAIELWEPRFRVTQITYPTDNTPDNLRKGLLDMNIVGVYRPNALAGDFTPASNLYALRITGTSAELLEVTG